MSCEKDMETRAASKKSVTKREACLLKSNNVFFLNRSSDTVIKMHENTMSSRGDAIADRNGRHANKNKNSVKTILRNIML